MNTKKLKPATSSNHTRKKALFLDRDGIINKDKYFICKIKDVEFCKGIFSFCRKAQKKGYVLIVVTNQAGVAKGLYTEQDVEILHNWMKGQFKKRGIEIKEFFFCPYHKDAAVLKYKRISKFRKPEPGMILKAVKKWNIDILKSYMIGDKDSDRIKLKGLRSYIIKSEYIKKGYDFKSLKEVEKKLFG